MKNIGKIIKARRLELGLSLEKVAQRADTSYKSVLNIEHGGHTTTKVLFKILDVLGLKIYISDIDDNSIVTTLEVSANKSNAENIGIESQSIVPEPFEINHYFEDRVTVQDDIEMDITSLKVSENNISVESPHSAKEGILDPVVAHSTRIKRNKHKTGKAQAMLLGVRFPDGSYIEGDSAVETCVKCIQKIGITRVRKVVEDYNLVFCKVPVISNRRDKKYGHAQQELGGGWLLMTNTPNPRKKAFLEKVSDVLGLGLVVELK